MGLLFKYSLTDAWHIPFSEIAVFDNDPGYVFYWAKGKDQFAPLLEQESIDLDEATLKKIRELISEISVTKVETLEHVIVLDGYIQEFSYKLDGREAEFSGYNLACCKEQPKLYPNAMTMLRLLQKLKDILAPMGVDKNCFALSRR